MNALSQDEPRAVTRPVRVMVVDDSADYRETLLAILDTDDLEIVGEASSGEASLRLVPQVMPDIVLMDVRMPHMNGVETTRQLKARHPEIGVIALTVHDEHDSVREMLAAGATGYVLKDDDGSNIVEAVQQAARTGGVLSPGVAPTVIEEFNDALERERRRASELENAHDQLVSRVAQRHELVSRLGHELRGPVSVIYGVARTLANEQVPAREQDELLERLLSRTSQLMRLVERFEAAVDEELVEPIRLRDLIAECVTDLPRVTITEDPPVPAVPLNPILARRVVEELVDNALRFAPASAPVEIWIGVVGSRVKVKIMDRGPGIAPEDHERIFEPLQQTEDVDSRVHQGAGVGLSLARAAARAMEGDVELETSGPAGSTFVWTIPLDTGRLLT